MNLNVKLLRTLFTSHAAQRFGPKRAPEAPVGLRVQSGKRLAQQACQSSCFESERAWRRWCRGSLGQRNSLYEAQPLRSPRAARGVHTRTKGKSRIRISTLGVLWIAIPIHALR